MGASVDARQLGVAMNRIWSAVFLAFAMFLAGLSPALADMSGSYVGIGEDTGTTLVLTQSRSKLTGEFTGTVEGSLTGTLSGANRVEGTLDVTSTNTRYTFRAVWTEAGFDITLYDQSGATELHQFRPAGTAAPIEPAAATQYWVYDNDTQFGPLSLQQVLDRIASGESGVATLVWTEGQTDWVGIEQLPELAAALTVEQPPVPAGDYYVYDNGVQSGPMATSDVVDGIAAGTISKEALVWTTGWPDWQKIDSVEEFAAAFAPVAPPSSQYYVVADGQRVGPLTEAEMLDRIAAHESTGDDLAWKKGLADWTPLSGFTEFEQALADAEIPPLPPADDDQPPALPGEEDGPAAMPGDDDHVVPPADNALADKLDEAIYTVLFDELAERPGDLPAAAACIRDVLAPLSDEDKQMLVDAKMNPSSEQIDALEAKHPGVSDGVEACVSAGQDGGMVVDGGDEEIFDPNNYLVTLQGMIEARMPELAPTATGAGRAEAVKCIMDVFEPLGPETWLMFIDSNLEPSQEQMDQLLKDHPTFNDDSNACANRAEEMKDSLDAVLWEALQNEIPDAPTDLKLKVYACLREAMSPLSQEHRDLASANGTNMSQETQDLLEKTYPGIKENVEACQVLAHPEAGGDDGSTTTGNMPHSEVTLPDGRGLAVTGGTSQSISAVDGGYAIDIDGNVITYSNGTITMGGAEFDAPPFKQTLEIVSRDGALTFVADGKVVSSTDDPPPQEPVIEDKPPTIITPEGGVTDDRPKTLSDAVEESLKSQGAPDFLVTQMLGCIVSAYSTMDQADQQAIIDAAPNEVSAEQSAAFLTKYPGMQDRLQACAPKM